MLAITGQTTIHKRNLQNLGLEIYKTLNELNPSFMMDALFCKIIQYDLRKRLLL